MDDLKNFANETETIIIGGSFYNEERKNVCPIIIPGHEIYYNEKINLSPVGEDSPYDDEGPISGENLFIIKNSPFGSFGVLICADYLDDELKTQIYKKNIDFMFVVSLNTKSDEWHVDMNRDCMKNKEGIYLIYANSIMENAATGKSAIFGLIHNKHIDPKLHSSVKYKFMEIIDENIIVADFNIRHKKPSLPNNIKTGTIIKPIYPYSSKKAKVLTTFFNAIGLNEKRYKQIDDLYVPPNNFESIYEKLKSEKIVFLIGDPEMGKTYTSFKLLLDSYRDGYEPVYEEKSGLENHLLKIDKLTADKKAIYFEDPWGTTELKCVDILQDICELIEYVHKYDTRIIITSRKKIIRGVEEIIDNLCDLSGHLEELNVGSAYNEDSLKELLQKYIRVFTPKWHETDELVQLVYSAIENQTLKTPMSIQKVIESNEAVNTTDKEILKEVIHKSAERTDIAFGAEIKAIYKDKDFDKIGFLCFPLISSFEIELIKNYYDDFLTYLNDKLRLGIFFKEFDSLIKWFNKELEVYNLPNQRLLKFSHDYYKNGCIHAVFTNKEIYDNIFYPILDNLSKDQNSNTRLKVSNSIFDYFEKFPNIPTDLIDNLCNDKNSDVRVSVGKLIANKFELFDPIFARKILRKLSKDDEIEVKIAVGQKFAENFDKSPNVAEIFIRNLSSYDGDDVRDLVIELFYTIYLKFPNHAKELLKKFSNDDDDVRMTACDILESYHNLFGSLSERLLLSLSNDLNYNVRSSAETILTESYEDHYDELDEDGGFVTEDFF